MSERSGFVCGWSLEFNCLGLVSENKVLCHPSSVDSLSTAAGQEDHVSMGGFAARKALSVVRNVEKGQVLKIPHALGEG